MDKKIKTVAIVGAGVAGARLASLMAGNGLKVMLFDHQAPWDKPCGGGLTHKVFRDFPDLREMGLNRRKHHLMELIFPNEKTFNLSLQWSLSVVSRKLLGEKLLERSTEAGAQFHPQKVKSVVRENGSIRVRTDSEEYGADLVVGADGVSSMVRKTFADTFAREDLCLTYSVLLPINISMPIILKFFERFNGYAWILPRYGDTSVGVAIARGDAGHDELAAKLEEFVQGQFKRRRISRPDLSQGHSRFVPAMRTESFTDPHLWGEGWALVGDASGAADPLTGEGIYYALATAGLLSEAVLSDNLSAYGESWSAMATASIAKISKVNERFYDHKNLNRLPAFLDYSPSVRMLTRELIAGRQDYWTLKARVKSDWAAYAKEYVWNRLTKKKGERV